MGVSLDEAQSRARYLKQKIEQTRSSWQSKVDPSEAPLKDAADDLIGEVGAAITKDLFGRKRPGRKAAKGLTKAQRKRRQQELESKRKDQALQLADELERIIESAAEHVHDLNYGAFMRRLGEARSAVKPETVLRRTEAEAEQFIRYVPPKSVQEESRNQGTTSADSLKRLRDLEMCLRDYVVKSLSEISENWWKERVPHDVREEAERRKERDDSPWPHNSAKEHRLIDYVDFPDYRKIICKRDNWRERFQEDFRRKHLIQSKLEELEPIRNALAHSRELTDKQEDKLQLYATEILDRIR